MPYNKEDLIKYRLQRAKTTVEEARSAIAGNFLFNDNNINTNWISWKSL